MKRVGYIRVSSKDQNLDRQMESMKALGIEEKYIYIDKQSGKDFDRIGYQYMKKALEEGDILHIHSLDRFGRNYNDIINEWNTITKTIKADIKVLDMELLDTTKHKDLLGNFISDLVLQVLSFVAHKERDSIKQRQKEGISSLKARNNGKGIGRPVIKVSKDFTTAYMQWKANEITAVKAMEISGLSKATFYRKVKEYEAKEG
ncbi:MAG: recombinase family protein [Desulfitobacteriaceae bacterium]